MKANCFPRVVFALFPVTLLLLSRATRAAEDTFAYVPRSDGTIVRFRADARAGKLDLLPGATDTGIKRPVKLVLSADKKILYVYRAFDREADGYSTESSDWEKWARASHSKPTVVQVYALQSGGRLHRLQNLTVPGPVGQMVCHPGGRFVYALTAWGAFLFKTSDGASKGRLRFAGRIKNMASGMGLEDETALRDGYWLTFSPSGGNLYDYVMHGFSWEQAQSLERYRVSPSTGRVAQDGESWLFNNQDDTRDKAAPIPHPVWFIVNRTAFLQAGSGFIVCPVSLSERIVWRRKPFFLHPAKESETGYDVNLVRHPTRPLVVFRGDYATPYTILRISAPGKIAQVGAFPSAFGVGSGAIAIEPSGHFLYEFSTPYDTVYIGGPRVAVFALSPGGSRVKRLSSRFTLPRGCDTENIVFVNVPARKP